MLLETMKLSEGQNVELKILLLGLGFNDCRKLQ
jgi:hypothetical protein